jgi:hypothetical protein
MKTKKKRQRKSLRKAIDGMCKQCFGGGKISHAKEIRECSYEKCSLWEVRPYQNLVSGDT